MNFTIRIVKPTETALLETAWKWHELAPKWFRDSYDAEDETKEDFLQNAGEPLLIGVFQDSAMTALLRFSEVAPDVCNIDLFAHRETDGEMLTTACFSVQKYLFDKGVKGLYGWTVKQNRFVVNLYKKLGFRHDGIKRFRGKIKNRPCEWLYFENFLTSNANTVKIT